MPGAQPFSGRTAELTKVIIGQCRATMSPHPLLFLHLFNHYSYSCMHPARMYSQQMRELKDELSVDPGPMERSLLTSIAVLHKKMYIT